MTLHQWAELQPYRVQQHSNGCMHIPDGNLVQRSDAWYLTDWRVSSVSGGTIWFIPREPKTTIPGININCW